MNNNQKAQGAIEYLLIIGAAIIVVAIVIIFITGIASTAPNSRPQVQSGYQGILDIYDKATNTATVILKLKGNGVENNIEFQSFKTANTINDLFGSLPEGTQISLAECNNGNPILKTSNGWAPQEGNCEVIVGTSVKIVLPIESQDQEVVVKTEIEKEPIYLISDGATLLSAINSDPSAHYKLTENIELSENFQLETFNGILEGNNNDLTITNTGGFPIIKKIENAIIKNLYIGGFKNLTDNDNIIDECINSEINIIFRQTIEKSGDSCSSTNCTLNELKNTSCQVN